MHILMDIVMNNILVAPKIYMTKKYFNRRFCDLKKFLVTRLAGTTRLRTQPICSSMLFTASITLLAGCGGGGATEKNPALASAASGVVAHQKAELSAVAKLGERIFNDASLSASGRVSCASCHVASQAHAPDNALAMQPGGADLHAAGTRTTPSLRYLRGNPVFSFDKNGAPSGGFMRDGRAASLAEQAALPFLGAREMANASKADVVGRLRQATYADLFRATFGTTIFDRVDEAFNRTMFALQRFQQEAPEFALFNAKYDQFLAGKAALNPAELRGLALFNDRSKGNCIACHPSGKNTNGSPPLFTDFSYDNLGVPRNPLIAENADQTYFDLGLCGPNRTDLAVRSELCGKFKVPTLRNVATRRVFFHNGRFTTLRDVLGFYVRRDTNPEEWYPRAADGSINKFDDLPPQYMGNVNRTEVPYNRQPGMQPALSAAEIDDVIAFLGTLTDSAVAPD